MKYFATFVVLLCSVTAACVPAEPSEVEASLRYWREAKPIVEGQIAEVGRPLATLLVEINAQLVAGNRLATNQWNRGVEEARPKLGKYVLELSSLEPPPGRAAHWHLAQLKAWGKRLEAMDAVLALGVTETPMVLWEGSRVAGQEADRLQVELLDWLAASR